jgi:hypothetical protein
MISWNLYIICTQHYICKNYSCHTPCCPSAHTHTHTHFTPAVLPLVEDLWKCYLLLLLDLLLFSIQCHVLETNDKLSRFLNLGKRQQSRAVWLGYNLFHDQKLLHCGGDMTISVYMERNQNVAQYLEDYPPNGIPTNFQKYKISTAIHHLCYRHKQAQIAPKARSFRFLLCKYKFINGSYLEITTGTDRA